MDVDGKYLARVDKTFLIFLGVKSSEKNGWESQRNRGEQYEVESGPNLKKTRSKLSLPQKGCQSKKKGSLHDSKTQQMETLCPPRSFATSNALARQREKLEAKKREWMGCTNATFETWEKKFLQHKDCYNIVGLAVVFWTNSKVPLII